VDAADVGKKEDEREHGGEHLEGRGKGREGEKKETKPARKGRVLGIMTQNVYFTRLARPSALWVACELSRTRLVCLRAHVY